jgi:small-conductance mechanosensitive channel
MAAWIRNLVSTWNGHEILLTALIVVGAWTAARIFASLVEKVGRRWVRRTASKLDDYILDAVARNAAWLIFLGGIYVALHRFTFLLLSFLDGILFVVGVVLVTNMLIRVLVASLRWYSEKIGKELEGQTLAREMLPVVDKVGKVLFCAIGLVVILGHFRIEIRSILVTLGVGSLAIGLALQDTLANMFGGFTIMLDRPFRLGDRIQLSSGESGEVLTIGMRSTQILTDDGNVLVVPNAILVRSMVTNHSFPDERSRITIDVDIAYGADPEQAKQLMMEVANENSKIIRTGDSGAFFRSFGKSGLNMMLVCYIASFRDRRSVIDALNSAINARFKSAGIEMPYPILANEPREEGK